MEKSDIQFLRDILKKINDLTIEFSNTIVPALQRFGDEMDACYKAIYPLLRKEYESAGCPLGSDDDAMWKWFRARTKATESSGAAGAEDMLTKEMLKLRELVKHRIN